jgi:hypothetical protein
VKEFAQKHDPKVVAGQLEQILTDGLSGLRVKAWPKTRQLRFGFIG